MEILVRSGKNYVDRAGERIWFPKDGQPYFDKAARREFKSVREKADFLNSLNYVSNGDSDEKAKRQHKEHIEKKMDEKSKMY